MLRDRNLSVFSLFLTPSLLAQTFFVSFVMHNPWPIPQCRASPSNRMIHTVNTCFHLMVRSCSKQKKIKTCSKTSWLCAIVQKKHFPITEEMIPIAIIVVSLVICTLYDAEQNLGLLQHNEPSWWYLFPREHGSSWNYCTQLNSLSQLAHLSFNNENCALFTTLMSPKKKVKVVLFWTPLTFYCIKTVKALFKQSLCSTKGRKPYRFRTTWQNLDFWVNYQFNTFPTWNCMLPYYIVCDKTMWKELYVRIHSIHKTVGEKYLYIIY